MGERLKGFGAVALGLGGLVLILLLIGLFIHGVAWVSEHVYPWLVVISSLTLGVVVLLLLPLSFVRRARGFSAGGLLIASYIFGAAVWVWGLLLTYQLWGAWAVFVGLFLLGIGVVPIAILATLFNGMWPELTQLVVLTVLVIGLRVYAANVVRKVGADVFARI